MAAATSKLPVEVELMFDVMPCQAMRRSYDGAEDAHACSHFAEWGLLHSYDYADDGPPARPGVVQPARYAGKRHVVPEILSGCRKAPILAVGINPNLPGWREGDRNAIHPYFDDYLQYAHYFRWRALDKLDIPRAAYDRLLDGRDDDTPQSGRPLTGVGGPIEVTPAPVTMYRQYQTLLDLDRQLAGGGGHLRPPSPRPRSRCSRWSSSRRFHNTRPPSAPAYPAVAAAPGERPAWRDWAGRR